jgi:poly(A) polymerase
MAEEILTRLRFPRIQIETVTEVVRHHMQFKDAPRMRPATLRRMLLRETFPLELELHRLDCLGSHGRLDIHDFLRGQAAEFARQPEFIAPLLTGRDLLALGFESGKGLGELLARLREKQLAEELTTPAEARAWAARQLPAPPNAGANS